jgi:hypothetical protein
MPSAEPETPPPRPWARWKSWVGRGLLALVLAVVGFEAWMHIVRGNIREVLPGRVYRGAQPSANRLEWAVRHYGIRTVVNLRGYCWDGKWYHDECRGSQRLGLSQEDLVFSASHLPSKWELRQLIEVLTHSEPPILIHCYRGVDRTGLASAIALILADRPLAEARKCLSLRYGHLPFGRTGNMERCLDLYEDWLAQEGRAHSRQAFCDWVENGYCGDRCSARYQFLGVDLADGRTVPRPRPTPAPGPSSGAPHPLRVQVPMHQPMVFRVRFHNTSDGPWRFSTDSNTGVHAFWRFRHDIYGQIIMGRAGRFNAEVGPGERIDLALAVPPVRAPGVYLLQIDMCDEQHCFFHEVASEPLEIEVEAK